MLPALIVVGRLVEV